MAKDKDEAPEAPSGKKAEGQAGSKKSEAKGEPKGEPKGESKKSEAKAEPKGESKAEGKKAEGKPEAKGDAKKAESKDAKKDEAKAEAKGESKKDEKAAKKAEGHAAGKKDDKGGKKGEGKKGEGKKGDKAAAEPKSSTPAEEPRKRRLYREQVIAALTKQFAYKNPMQVPRLVKINVNMGLGAAIANPKIIDSGVEEMRAITGQKPVVTRAKKAIATFKLRAGVPIGVTTTLRRERMWEFFDRLCSLSLPRMRDFKGVSPRGFDGQGNYTLGLKEQIIFPEIDYDKIDVIKGVNITFVTTAKTDDEGRALLGRLGMPYRS